MLNKIKIIENFISEKDAKNIIQIIESDSIEMTTGFYGTMFSNNEIIKKYNLLAIKTHEEINKKQLYTCSASGAKWISGSYTNLHRDTNNAPWVEFTTIIYLNDDFSGGELNFPHLNFLYKPQAFSAILFPSSNKEYDHNVLKINSGNRYTVLFMHTSNNDKIYSNFI